MCLFIGSKGRIGRCGVPKNCGAVRVPAEAGGYLEFYGFVAFAWMLIRDLGRRGKGEGKKNIEYPPQGVLWRTRNDE